MQAWQDKVAHELEVGRKLHGLMPPFDMEYMNEMYDGVS